MKTVREATPQTRAFRRAFFLALAFTALFAVFFSGLPEARADGKPKAPRRSGMGATFGPVTDRPSLPLRSCDYIEPICIHFDDRLAPGDVARLRASAARAYALIVETQRFPAPLFDEGRGGDGRLDVYAARPTGLVFDREGLAVIHEAPSLEEDRDAAPAYLVIDPVTVSLGGCTLDFALSHGVARASAYGLDVAETDAVVSGFTRYEASVVAPCPELDKAPFAALQAAPWRSIAETEDGNAYLARFIDEQRGAGYGALVPALLSMAIQHEGIVVPVVADFEYGPAHFRNQPTLFDVLAASLTDAGSALDDLLLDATIARAIDHPEAPPQLDWTLKSSTLPRRVEVPRGVEAMGATFVRIDLDRAPKNQTVELDLDWEQGARFRFAVLKLDAQGNNIGSVGVPALERARTLTLEVRKLDGVAAILIVGFNSGDPMFPWFPDDPEKPPHGYQLGVYEGE